MRKSLNYLHHVHFPQIFLILLLLCINQTKGQNNSNYYFSILSSEQGLSNNNIKAFYQDSFGFIWIGTRNGLNRYDGSTFSQYNCLDENENIGCNEINAITEDYKKRLWLGTNRGIFIYQPQINKFSKVAGHKDTPTPNNWVANIFSDSGNNIWVLIPQQGVFKFKKGNENDYQFYKVFENSNKEQTRICMGITNKGVIWIGTSSAGLFYYDAKKNDFEKINCSNNLINNDIISAISFDEENPILATYHHGLLIYDISKKEFRVLLNIEGIPTALMQTEKQIWLGTYNGLYILSDYQSQSCKILSGPFNLSNQSITTFYKDKENNIWIGTMLGGVNFLPSNYKSISKYIVNADGRSLSSKFIRGLTEDQYGNIWIGTEDGGINILNPESNEISQLKGDYNLTLCLRNYHDTIYCGLFKKGLELFPSHNKQIQCISNKKLGITESIYSFIIDKKNQKWIGNDYGLYKANDGFNFHKVRQIRSNWIFDILEAYDGTLWLAAVGNGIIHYNPTTDIIISENKSEKLRSINSIFQDTQKRIWISSDQHGIGLLNETSNQFEFFGQTEGLPDNATYKIIEDNQGYLWFGTNKGLVKFNPNKKRVERVYTKRNGLLNDQFNYGAALKARDGKLYFGGINGLISFYPEQFNPEHNLHTASFPICISKMSIYNQEITTQTDQSPLKLEMPYTNRIELKYNQSNISFDVALLDYASQSAIDYYYQMEPLDKEWIKASSNTNISYARLPAGNYQFHIKAFYSGFNERPINSQTLFIRILPPWWLSPIAYICYALLCLVIIIFSLRWYQRRKEKQMQVKQKFFEIEKEKELYESKIKFFTTVAHEFRTPLTLISGPLEMIFDLHTKDATLNKYLNIIQCNTQQLLDLSNQMINFYKDEQNNDTLTLSSVNINQLIEDTLMQFSSSFILAKKQTQCIIPEHIVTAQVDKKAIIKILNNLLSNALKYADTNVIISLSSDSDSFSIRVESDGEKIPAEKNEDIFHMFYRLDRHINQSGIGLGLCMSRQLAQKHNGNLYLDSSSSLNSFVLTIPYLPDSTEQSVLNNSQSEEYGDKNPYIIQDNYIDRPSGFDKHYHILIVEDNFSLGTFISDTLEKLFFVELASDGTDALSRLSERSFDLIITDLMMPGMDGLQFCKKIKNDINYSHIPVIILTAKNDMQSKIRGLELGAESYIEKPFSIRYLQMQMISLLQNREKLRETFTKQPFIQQTKMNVNNRDEKFIDHLTQQIMENLSDEYFNVESLASLMNMSSSTLLRKVKELFGISVVNFILLIRLKKAAELITKGDSKISDICLQVGISSPSYFSKQFTKQFGTTPKEFAKQYSHSKIS